MLPINALAQNSQYFMNLTKNGTFLVQMNYCGMRDLNLITNVIVEQTEITLEKTTFASSHFLRQILTGFNLQNCIGIRNGTVV